MLRLNVFNNLNIQESKNTLNVRYHKASTNTVNVPIPEEILFLLFQNVSLNSDKNENNFVSIVCRGQITFVQEHPEFLMFTPMNKQNISAKWTGYNLFYQYFCI